jgi:hypothetical protein
VEGRAPAADAAEAPGVQHGGDDLAAAVQRLDDVLLGRTQGIEVRGAAQRPRVEQHLRQGWRVRQALQHTVQEAGVA